MFDVIVIGGGQAGIPLAHALAEAGQKIALIERSHLGGSCVNFGCTPTKAVVASARDGILILNAETLKITDVNPYMVEFLKYSRAEFIGKEVWEIGVFSETCLAQRTRHN